MPELLSVEEARVLGCLLEKEAATPEYYPLTLNALRNACNQSSSRNPVVSYGDREVSQALATLREKGLIRIVYSQSNRAAKYRHVLDEVLGLDREERAVLCLLLLRGPQTVGELRTRSDRLATFDSLEAVERVLTHLSDREDPLVARLDRGAGQKEARNRQLLAPDGGPEPGRYQSPGSPPDASAPLSAALDSSRPDPEASPGYAGAEPGGVGEVGEPRAPGPGAAPDIRSEVADLRTQLTALQADMGELRSALEQLRRQVGSA